MWFVQSLKSHNKESSFHFKARKTLEGFGNSGVVGQNTKGKRLAARK